MIAAPLTRSKTDHYTGALAASRNGSAQQPVSAERPISGRALRHHDTH